MYDYEWDIETGGYILDMILSNKKYCGFSVARGGKMAFERENHHEPIITLDLFEKVQTAKAERSNVEIGEDGKAHRKNTKHSSQRHQKQLAYTTDTLS